MTEGSGEQGVDVEFVEYLVGQVANPGDLERLKKAIARRRWELEVTGKRGPEGRASSSLSRLKEARPHEDGYLQAETRIYRSKEGWESERGPYWYFRYHEGGKQRKLYLGRTDDPEGTLKAKRGARA